MALGQVFFEITLEFKQVSAGAKLGAGTRQHQHTHRLVLLQVVERLQKIAAHLRHHAVATLGPVHGQQCDALGNLFKPHSFKRHPITDFCHIRLDQFKIQLKVLTLLATTRAEVPSSHLPPSAVIYSQANLDIAHCPALCTPAQTGARAFRQGSQRLISLAMMLRWISLVPPPTMPCLASRK